jgi:hypothetical protein
MRRVQKAPNNRGWGPPGPTGHPDKTSKPGGAASTASSPTVLADRLLCAILN